MEKTEVVTDQKQEIVIDQKEIITSDQAVIVEETGSVDEAEARIIEKKLVRKIDLRIIPWISLLYLLLSLDRNNIGNARLSTLEADLGMVGNQYNTALTIFFAGYVIFHLPGSLLVKIMQPYRLISCAVILWGISSICQSATHTAAQLTACRFLLGAFEAGAGPSIPLFLSFWYRREELATRVAIYIASSTVAGSFAGAIAYGVLGNLSGAHGLAGWRWLFIIEAAPTIAFGILSFFVLPSMPNNAGRWLTEKEREIAIQRTKEGGNTDTKTFDKKQFLAALTDYKIWLSVTVYSGMNVALASFSVFIPTIIRDLGFSSLNAQLLSITPYAVATCSVFLISWNSDRTLQRGYHITLSCCIAIVGYIFLLASDIVGLRYTGAILIACGVYPIIPLTLTWVANNQLGHTKRAMGVGMTNMIAQCFSMVGTQVYKTQDAPRYIRGNVTCVVFLGISAMAALLLRFLLNRENKRRDREYGTPESSDMSKYDIQDVYDNHPQFRYAL
ncbi:MFS general substrate transporter [Backusella circina FSU 941]|nr:MFS general substrate transporter [Backusella circina FSU 941]